MLFGTTNTQATLSDAYFTSKLVNSFTMSEKRRAGYGLTSFTVHVIAVA